MDKMRLVEELRKHKGKTVCIGARSSFFFVGPAEEAMSDIRILGMMARLCVALGSRRRIGKKALKSAMSMDIGSRLVEKAYNRSHAYDSEVVIIIEGSEFGAFWSRGEYLSCRDALVSAVDAAGLGGNLAET